MKLRVTIMPKADVLDPQGRAIAHALTGMGFSGVDDVRVGKTIVLDMTETDPAAAKAQAEDMCRRLLANDVIEDFRVDPA